MIFHTTDRVFILYINSFVIIIMIISRNNFCSTVAYARSLMFVSMLMSYASLRFVLFSACACLIDTMHASLWPYRIAVE